MWAILVFLALSLVAIYLVALPTPILTLNGVEFKARYGRAWVTRRVLVVRGDSDLIAKVSKEIKIGRPNTLVIPGDGEYTVVPNRMDLSVSVDGMIKLHVLWAD